MLQYAKCKIHYNDNYIRTLLFKSGDEPRIEKRALPKNQPVDYLSRKHGLIIKIDVLIAKLA